MKLTTQSLLAALLTTSLAVPGAALADHRGDGDREYGYRFDHHRVERHRDRHFGRIDHRDYRDQRITRVYRDNDDDRLLLGLVVGGLLGYAINNAQHAGSTYYDSPRAYPDSYVAADTYSTPDTGCLQEREYTTTVRVGGRNVEAYGTACLQPDGSWRRGPAQTVNY
jgi:hypothetical protein